MAHLIYAEGMDTILSFIRWLPFPDIQNMNEIVAQAAPSALPNNSVVKCSCTLELNIPKFKLQFYQSWMAKWRYPE